MELQSLDKIGPVLQALAALIGALGKAPAWFALLLAGVLVVWVSGATYTETCKPLPNKSLNKGAQQQRIEAVQQSTIVDAITFNNENSMFDDGFASSLTIV